MALANIPDQWLRSAGFAEGQLPGVHALLGATSSDAFAKTATMLEPTMDKPFFVSLLNLATELGQQRRWADQWHARRLARALSLAAGLAREVRVPRPPLPIAMQGWLRLRGADDKQVALASELLNAYDLEDLLDVIETQAKTLEQRFVRDFLTQSAESAADASDLPPNTMRLCAKIVWRYLFWPGPSPSSGCKLRDEGLWVFQELLMIGDPDRQRRLCFAFSPELADARAEIERLAARLEKSAARTAVQLTLALIEDTLAAESRAAELKSVLNEVLRAPEHEWMLMVVRDSEKFTPDVVVSLDNARSGLWSFGPGTDPAEMARRSATLHRIVLHVFDEFARGRDRQNLEWEARFVRLTGAAIADFATTDLEHTVDALMALDAEALAEPDFAAQFERRLTELSENDRDHVRMAGWYAHLLARASGHEIDTFLLRWAMSARHPWLSEHTDDQEDPLERTGDEDVSSEIAEIVTHPDCSSRARYLAGLLSVMLPFDERDIGQVLLAQLRTWRLSLRRTARTKRIKQAGHEERSACEVIDRALLGGPELRELATRDSDIAGQLIHCLEEDLSDALLVRAEGIAERLIALRLLVDHIAPEEAEWWAADTLIGFCATALTDNDGLSVFSQRNPAAFASQRFVDFLDRVAAQCDQGGLSTGPYVRYLGRAAQGSALTCVGDEDEQLLYGLFGVGHRPHYSPSDWENHLLKLAGTYRSRGADKWLPGRIAEAQQEWQRVAGDMGRQAWDTVRDFFLLAGPPSTPEPDDEWLVRKTERTRDPLSYVQGHAANSLVLDLEFHPDRPKPNISEDAYFRALAESFAGDSVVRRRERYSQEVLTGSALVGSMVRDRRFWHALDALMLDAWQRGDTDLTRYLTVAESLAIELSLELGNAPWAKEEHLPGEEESLSTEMLEHDLKLCLWLDKPVDLAVREQLVSRSQGVTLGNPVLKLLELARRYTLHGQFAEALWCCDQVLAWNQKNEKHGDVSEDLLLRTRRDKLYLLETIGDGFGGLAFCERCLSEYLPPNPWRALFLLRGARFSRMIGDRVKETRYLAEAEKTLRPFLVQVFGDAFWAGGGGLEREYNLSVEDRDQVRRIAVHLAVELSEELRASDRALDALACAIQAGNLDSSTVLRFQSVLEQGRCLHALGDNEGAVEVARTAYGLASDNADDVPAVLRAEASQFLAEALQATGPDSLQDVAALTEETLAFALKRGSADWVQRAYSNRARAHFALGEHEEGIRKAQRAVRLIERMRRLTTGYDKRVSVTDGREGIYRALVRVMWQTERPSEALGYIERLRGRTLEDWRNRRSTVSLAFFQYLDKRRPPLHSALETLRQRMDGGTPEPVHELQLAIPEGAALVEYYLDGENLYVFLMTKHEQMARELGLSREDQLRLAAQLVRLTSLLGSADWRAFGLSLGKLLMRDEVLVWLRERNVARLIIVPHDFLHRLPLHLMAFENTLPHATLGDLFAISYLPAVSMLSQRSLPVQSRPSRLLVSFAPLVAGQELPYAYLEAALAHAVCGFSGPPPVAKSAATRESLRAMAYLADYLLLTTHGVAVPGDEDRFRLYLSDVPLTAQDLLSAPGHERVHLKPGATVLCSACFTAIGQLKASDETVGAVTAFLSEGANAVTSTLWPVDDLATSFLMTFLLREVARGVVLPEALRLAQLQLRQLTAEEAVARLLSWEKVLNEGHMVPAEVIGLIWSAVAEMALCSQPPNAVLAREGYRRATMILTNEKSPYLATVERRRESVDLTKGSAHPRYGATYPFANPHFWAGLVAHSLV